MTNNLLVGSFARRASFVFLNHVQRRNMPVNVPPTATGKRRFRLAVETDPHKLVNYCCGLNYHIDEPPIKLKPDEEYPEWLWNLRLTEKPNSWEMEPGTKEYYLRLKEEEFQLNRIKRLTKRGEKKYVGEVEKKMIEYKHHIRFAALAHMEEDAGLPLDEIQEDWTQRIKKSTRLRDYYLPVDENRVIYKDKIEGNAKLKNFYIDSESTFKRRLRVGPKTSTNLRPIQDSKRRHRYAVE